MGLGWDAALRGAPWSVTSDLAIIEIMDKRLI